MGYRKWTDEDLIQAAKASFTKAEVMKKIGISNRNAGNYTTLDKHIKRLQIDISHFTQRIYGNAEGKKEYAIEEVFIKNSTYSNRVGLKTKILKNKLLEEKCHVCGITEWCGVKLVLQLDHIDGDRTNNVINNLRFICPNCHSQTETFCKGIRKKKVKYCIDCDIEIGALSTRCKKCFSQENKFKENQTKIKWPEYKKLLLMVEKNGFVKIGKMLGVSDNAVRKRLKTRAINAFVDGE